MAVYSGQQVVSVKELRIGEKLHCGKTGGECMVWTVADKDEAFAYIKVGAGAVVKMSGRSIRSGLPMFRAIDCPVCSIKTEPGVNGRKPATPKSDNVSYTSHQLQAADVRSPLGAIDNVRKKNLTNTGGALMDTPAKRRRALAQRYVRQILSREV